MRTLPLAEPTSGWVLVYIAAVLLLSLGVGIWLDRRDNAKADAESWRKHVASMGGQQ